MPCETFSPVSGRARQRSRSLGTTRSESSASISIAHAALWRLRLDGHTRSRQSPGRRRVGTMEDDPGHAVRRPETLSSRQGPGQQNRGGKTDWRAPDVRTYFPPYLTGITRRCGPWRRPVGTGRPVPEDWPSRPSANEPRRWSVPPWRRSAGSSGPSD